MASYTVPQRGWRIPPLVARHELPERWRFLVAVPSAAVPLVREYKDREAEILESMPPPPPGLAERLSRLLLLKLLPAAVEGDLETLLEALTEFNGGLGSEYWSSRQGGAYCCPLAGELVGLLKQLAGGAAQSSWGPAVYTIFASSWEAARAASTVRRWLTSRGGGMVYVAGPDNRGAVVERLQ